MHPAPSGSPMAQAKSCPSIRQMRKQWACRRLHDCSGRLQHMAAAAMLRQDSCSVHLESAFGIKPQTKSYNRRFLPFVFVAFWVLGYWPYMGGVAIGQAASRRPGLVRAAEVPEPRFFSFRKLLVVTMRYTWGNAETGSSNPQ